MSSVIVNNSRQFDEHTSRLSFNAPSGYYVQSQYHANDAAGTDCRTYSDAASCESSRSPGMYRTCGCRGALDAADSPKIPADIGGLSRCFYRHHQLQQEQQPPSFAIHQLLGLGANIRNFNYDRQLALQTADSRHQPHTPPTPCAQAFNPDVDASLSPPNCLGLRASRHQLDLPFDDRPTSASVAAYCRQHRGLTAVGATKCMPRLREPLQLPPPLTPWFSDDPHLPRNAVNHHQQQQQQVPHDELQAYYCAARLQPSNVDVTSYDSVIRQCRNIGYLHPNFGMYIQSSDLYIHSLCS